MNYCLIICFTTIVRHLFGENIFLGHRNNLYQKLSSRYKNNILNYMRISHISINIQFHLYILVD